MHLPLTPIRCLYRGVDLYGSKEGVVSGDRRFTYAQFGERCERLAAGLLSLGVKPGDRVAYLSFNTNQLLEGYYGPALIQAMVMPLNVRLTPVELTQILNHSALRFSSSRMTSHRSSRPSTKTAPRSRPTSLLTAPYRRPILLTRNCCKKTASSVPIGLPSTKTPSLNCFTPAAAPARRRASRSLTAPCIYML